jgi:tetratricopeptide (TPR) repeat protein
MLPASADETERIIDDITETLAAIPQEQLEALQQNVAEGAVDPGEVLGFDPGTLAFIENTATTLYAAGHSDKALKIFAYLLWLAPKRSTAWRGYAACAHALKIYHLAFLAYQTALAFDPQDIASKVLLGEMLCQCGNKVGGLAYLKEAVDAGTDVAAYKPYLLRARAVLKAQGQTPSVALRTVGKPAVTDDKLLDLEEVLRSVRDEPPTLDEMRKHPKIAALMSEISGILRRNDFMLGDILEFTEAEYDGMYKVAASLIQNNDVEKGMKVLAYLMIFQPYSGRNLQLAGIGYAMLKRYDIAEFSYDLSLSFMPDDPMTLIYLGEVRLMLGKKAEGLVDLQKGLALVGKHPDSKMLKGRAQALIKMITDQK